MPTVETEPYVFEFDSRTTVQAIIPMQRDFVDQGWYVRRVRVDVSIPELMATDDSSARNVDRGFPISRNIRNELRS